MIRTHNQVNLKVTVPLVQLRLLVHPDMRQCLDKIHVAVQIGDNALTLTPIRLIHVHRLRCHHVLQVSILSRFILLKVGVQVHTLALQVEMETTHLALQFQYHLVHPDNGLSRTTQVALCVPLHILAPLPRVALHARQQLCQIVLQVNTHKLKVAKTLHVHLTINA